MEKIFQLAQFIIACLMFACVLTGAVAHIVMGHITSIIGFGVVAIFLIFTGYFVKVAWIELHEED